MFTFEHVILYINLWDSYCGYCGKSCSPDEKRHTINLGYGPENGTSGCGQEYTSMSSDYSDIKEKLQEMRPDLRYVDPFSLGVDKRWGVGYTQKVRSNRRLH